MNRLSWQELLTLLENAPDFAKRILHQPCRLALPHANLLSALKEAASSSGMSVLLGRHLLSSLASGASLDKNLVNECLLSCNHETVEQLHHATWKIFPIITARAFSCSITWIITALLQDSRNDTGSILTCSKDFAPESIIALKQSLAAVKNCSRDAPGSALFIPIINSPLERISGSSLGLAAALAMLSDYSNGCQNTVLATGGLAPSGKVLKVSMLETKAGFAAGIGATLICPSENFSTEHLYGNRVMPCHTLDEAVKATELILSCNGTESNFPLLIACANDPELFLTHFAQIPTTLLRTGMFQRILHEISSNTARYVDLLSTCLANVSSMQEHSGILLEILTPQKITATACQSPLRAVNAFRTVTSAIAALGHAGETAAIAPWLHAARKLETEAGASALAAHYNQLVSSLRHNRFDFRPELPEEFTRAFNTEKRVAAIRNEENWLLGAMCGTIAQNYGFCGPQYLGQVKKYVTLGINVFGRRYELEAPRLKNYLIYALMDAKQFDQAEKELRQNLIFDAVISETEGETRVPNMVFMLLEQCRSQGLKKQWSLSFYLAIALRLLADTGARFDMHDLFSRISVLVSMHRHHPWQLVALNCGRLALVNDGFEEAAKKFFCHALDICMSNSTTMNIMGLLPLSLMYRRCGISLSKHKVVLNKIIETISDQTKVETNHFKDLTQAYTMESVMEKVAAKPERWFPFSYR